MTFSEIALPYAKLGIPVFPLQPRDKRPVNGIDWDAEATTDITKITQWNDQGADSNCALVATLDGVFFLEFDQGSLEEEAARLKVSLPVTRVHISGKGGKHWVFRHNERSRVIGNRQATMNGSEWFSVRADRRYVVAPGSIHPNGNSYAVIDHSLPNHPPDWVLDFIERNTTKPDKPKGSREVHPDFDFDAFVNHYDLHVTFIKDDVWNVLEECPGVGYRHEQSILTGLFWDGSTLGWHCFAGGCPLCEVSIGEFIRFMNKSHEPYRGVIWSDSEIDVSDPVWSIEEADQVEKLVESACTDSDATSSYPPSDTSDSWETVGSSATHPLLSFDAALEEHAKDICPDLLPVPTGVAIEDPHKHEGLEFPGECTMYGKLRKMAMGHSRLQLGWLYPSLLAVASALDIEDYDHNVRSNIYEVNLGDVGMGKTACLDAAVKSVLLPIDTVMDETPSSDRGLANMLSHEEPLPRLLSSDEFRSVMGKCAIKGSTLPQMINTLWNKDKSGVSDKKGKQTCYAKLSVVGNVACKDPAEFATLFGAATVSGMYDRFVYGYATKAVRFRPEPVNTEMFNNLKPVRIPAWAWEAKDAWMDLDPEPRRRLGEHVLRVALVTAAVNGDREVTKACLEAAFRLMEWQQRIRNVYRPGLAETKEAECFEAVERALWEQQTFQIANGKAPKGASDITSVPDQMVRLLHFTQVVNKKSYYRKYAGLIDRVKRTLVENQIIEEVRPVEHDGHKKETKKEKTPFVRMLGRVR
jgi:hypothetical protein